MRNSLFLWPDLRQPYYSIRLQKQGAPGAPRAPKCCKFRGTFVESKAWTVSVEPSDGNLEAPLDNLEAPLEKLEASEKELHAIKNMLHFLHFLHLAHVFS